ncbi:uncharacterized protein LOC128742869 isoform X2 [Sabethes cyaneus]|uniref:uncharacterized protein LOC128742869 isoform X2 n=1 Tax=Sabethes cyaneus TaxID=53552 RepID=UPI00237EDB57|nr:uncharacterized protein LOC128742869 isoform X2 [Sabethes cyaneus]
METTVPEVPAGETNQSVSTKEPPNADSGDAEMFEPVPDDLNDFIVIDEAEITDDEGGDRRKDGGPPSEDEQESVQWDCPAHLLAPRTYTKRDLEPTERDPRCKIDWPLGTYWPVYVGNFRLFRKKDSDFNCLNAVHKYFASKGLPSFMVFRLKDDFFKDYQKLVGFYDFLVYFCCLKDANRAVQWCHRDLYYGYRLNVYSGRVPVYFSTQKAWFFKARQSEDRLESEENLESYFSMYEEVAAISKQDFDGVYVQFSAKTRFRDFHKDRFGISPILEQVQRQRYIEQDVEAEILKEIKDNPKFMNRRTPPYLMTPLMHGVIPTMNRNWETSEELAAMNPELLPPKVQEAYNLLLEIENRALLKNKKKISVTVTEWLKLKPVRQRLPPERFQFLILPDIEEQRVYKMSKLMGKMGLPKAFGVRNKYSNRLETFNRRGPFKKQGPQTLAKQMPPLQRQRTLAASYPKNQHQQRETPAAASNSSNGSRRVMPEGLSHKQARRWNRARRIPKQDGVQQGKQHSHDATQMDTIIIDD